MPEYLYTCANKHHYVIEEPMEIDFDSPHICPQCGGRMWRKPQVITVTWGGLKPSDGEHSLEFMNHVNNIDEIRDKTDEKYEKRARGIYR